MPPRFRDESIAALNKALLRRVPDCRFTPEDVEELKQSEDLSEAQINMFAAHFRHRNPDVENRRNVLVSCPEVNFPKHGTPGSGKPLSKLVCFDTFQNRQRGVPSPV